ncbi:hypothetical protein Tco_0020465 [Tanacetum coccineum]
MRLLFIGKEGKDTTVGKLSGTVTKLARAKPNKRSGDSDLSKDKSGPESPLEFWRRLYVKGHIRSGVINSVLMQWCQRTIRQRHSPCEGPLSLEGHLGDEGLCFEGTKLNSIFITAELGDEGLSSGGTKLNLIFITARVTFTKPK